MGRGTRFRYGMYGTEDGTIPIAKKRISGHLNISGASLDRQSLGLSKIYNVTVSGVSSTISGTTVISVYVGPSGSGTWPTTGVTQCCFMVYSGAGDQPNASAVSVAYTAVGY